MSEPKTRQKYDAFIDGVSIRSLSPILRVTGIKEQIVRPDVNTEAYPVLHGSFMLGARRRELTVQITFVLAEIYNLTARAQAVDAVNAWAKAGKLEVNYRPDKCIFVDAVTEYPSVENIKDLTGEYSVTLSAYAMPFWVDAVPVEVPEFIPDAVNGTTVTMQMSGNQTAYLEATVTIMEDSLTALSIGLTDASSALALDIPQETALSRGDVLRIAYDQNHFLFIRADEGGILQGVLTRNSSDHVLLSPGANAIHVYADTKVSVVLRARGVYA